ncbi:hypothetical protein [Longitalea luteola]|uniref:hypothetical protein n=1 Tax=Longitalea luteola TaxID=2812563 RepID=UPI001A969FAB|nr:hypothetical protein [Longitalea luteola]
MFAGLSFIWFALLLWNIHQPSTKTIAWHAVILFLAFTFRYNALIYPFITMIAFGLSKLPIRAKLVGASYGIILCGIFVCFTMYKYKQFTGYWQYSPFSGWQMANNAMYAYRSVDSADRGPVPLKYQALDNMIKDFYAKTNNGNVFPSEKALASTFYMWTPSMPLMRYRDSIFKLKDPKAGEFKKWASMGPFYKSYGMYIIKKYPYHFAEWFLWPNTRKYFAPPVEFLENYNSGRDAVTDQAKVWFGYKSVKVKSRLNNPHIWILAYYPIVTGIINILMLFGLLYYVLLKGWRINDVFNKTIIIGGAVWMFNAFFTIFASSAALRFQTFPILLTTIIALLLVDWLSQLLRSMNLNKRQVTIEEKEGNVFVA